MEIYTALNLLLIGMITVFVILFLVYGTGTLLIRVVNQLGGEDTDDRSKSDISNQKVAVLNAAVEAFTEGTGRITSIEKIK